MRVALIGHETYENRVEIKDIIFKLNKKFENDLIIKLQEVKKMVLKNGLENIL